MTKQNIVFLRLPKGSPAPGNGFTLTTSTRNTDIYRKMKPQITKSDIDEMSSMFGNLGVANNDVLIVPEDQGDAALEMLIGSMNTMGLGGSQKRRKTRKTRKSRKTRRHNR